MDRGRERRMERSKRGGEETIKVLDGERREFNRGKKEETYQLECYKTFSIQREGEITLFSSCFFIPFTNSQCPQCLLYCGKERDMQE